MSWKPEVQVAGEDNRWIDNEFRFATKAEAEHSARDLASRWLLVTNHRGVESPDPISYAVRNGRTIPLRRVKMWGLKHGDLVVVDGSCFDCHPGGEACIECGKDGPFFTCNAGRHHIHEGECNSDGYVVGVYKPLEERSANQ